MTRGINASVRNRYGGIYPFQFSAVDNYSKGVQGFPTVKVRFRRRKRNADRWHRTQLFPRGGLEHPMTYESGERTATAFFNWASRRVPSTVKKLSAVEDISSWVEKVCQ
jgi:protein disulfide-isomerase A6